MVFFLSVFQTPGSGDELNFSNGSSAFDDIGMKQLDTPTQKSDTPLTIPADDSKNMSFWVYTVSQSPFFQMG